VAAAVVATLIAAALAVTAFTMTRLPLAIAIMLAGSAVMASFTMRRRGCCVLGGCAGCNSLLLALRRRRRFG
jgi:hypothetical protein